MIISDIHLHSKYSRACSKDLDINNLEKWARIKGVDLLGTGDFTHPKWIQELKDNLTEDETGILKTKSGFNFVLQSEISFIYTQEGKGRRVHLMVLAPNFEIVAQITDFLKKKGRLDYDGRPIFNTSCHDFTYAMKKISDDIEIIPAHCLTPWFSIFGSNSGFDTVEECFKDQTKNIYALETGMSADPSMIWRVKDWRKYTLVSNSDSHSFWPWRMGREANIFSFKELTYKNIIKAIRTKEGLSSTIEVDPNYGKYHFTGHRKCNFVVSPKEALKYNNICPVCKSKLTVGVMARVDELADKPEGYTPNNAVPFKSLVPLSDLIAGLYKTGVSTKKVWIEYNKLLKEFKNEFNILLNVPEDELSKIVEAKLAEVILKNRKGKIKVKPGFDGVYGVPLIYGNEDYDFNADDDAKDSVKIETENKSKDQKGLGEYF